MLSPLLFIIVLEALTRQIRLGLPQELLYADDLGLVSITLECRNRETKSLDRSVRFKRVEREF